MHPIRVSASVARQVLRTPSSSPSVCAALRPPTAAFLPRRLGSRAASSAPASSSASPSPDASPLDAPFSSILGQTAASDGPSTTASSSSATTPTPTPTSSVPDPAAPSSSAKPPAPRKKQALKSSEGDAVGSEGSQSKPAKARGRKGRMVTRTPVKRELCESESFLPPDWQEDIETGLEALAVAGAQRRAEREAQQARREASQGAVKLRPKTRQQIGKEAAELLAKAVLRLRADACARAAERILDGFLDEMKEFKELVDDTNDWLRKAAEEDALSESFEYNVSTLRTDLLKHAEIKDVLKDAAGEPVLDAHGDPQPGPFQTLLRNDQDAWDRFVEDQGFLKEEESYETALKKMYESWHFTNRKP